MLQRRALVHMLVSLSITLPAIAGEQTPWAFNAPRGEGYRIDLVSIDPKPGTILTPGSRVTFNVTVRYSLTITKRADIVMVFQDETDASAKDNAPQAIQRVETPEGVVTLTDTIFVPRKKELVLYIPLSPDGMRRTTGEVTIRYPIKR